MSKVWERGWHLRWQWTWWSSSCHASLGEGRSLLSTGGQGRCGSQGEVREQSPLWNTDDQIQQSQQSPAWCAMLVPCLCQLLLKVAGVREKPGLSWTEQHWYMIQKHPETSKATPLLPSKSVWMTWDPGSCCDTVSCVQNLRQGDLDGAKSAYEVHNSQTSEPPQKHRQD